MFALVKRVSAAHWAAAPPDPLLLILAPVAVPSLPTSFTKKPEQSDDIQESGLHRRPLISHDGARSFPHW